MLAPKKSRHMAGWAHRPKCQGEGCWQYAKLILVVAPGFGNKGGGGYNHLLTDMWQHAWAKGLSVYSFLTSISHYSVAQVTSNFHNQQ